jgi:(1->4)-alpha-D-glucan 1-alpha-D-glucosylmutase
MTDEALRPAGPAEFERARRPLRAPVSTYRLQLHREFTFADVRAIVPYLSSLGVTDCYTSPYMMARPNSLHGYDVTNHNRLNPELGTEADFEAMTAAFAGHRLGHILDFVPNHMGIDPQTNPWWHDVLENGACSPSARFFDVDWEAVKPELKGRILLPILGAQYGQVLDRGELRLEFADGAFQLTYGGHRLPVNPRHSTKILRHGLERLKAELDEADPAVRELLSIVTELQNLPAYTESDPEKIAERRREKEVARDRLRRLTAASPRILRHIDEALAAFNGVPGRPETFDLLHELLEWQPYRLSYWRTASHEINYRRFFDINDLAGLRVEDPVVFEATHELVQRLLAGEKITGLRVDHPDGLYDPARYFEQVQDLARRAWSARRDAHVAAPLYLVAEKILSAGESLPESWAIHGTTGYNFLNELNGIFVDREGASTLRKMYGRFTGRTKAFADVVYESKKLIMETSLASELNVLAHALNRISEEDRHSRDFTLSSLHDALREIVACFPVYRTYVSESGWTDVDRAHIETAIRRARLRNPVFEPTIFDFVRDVLLPAPPAGDRIAGGGTPGDDRSAAAVYRRRLHFSMKFQQYTGPVQAKGLEDTAFYRDNVLLSLNEVGGDPSQDGRSPLEFHAFNRLRLERWPLELNTTATHDTKLGEDVRARLNVLSEIPDEWRREVWRWRRMNQGHRPIVDGEPAPDRNDEYRFYQVLLGVWPPGVADEPDAAAHAQALVPRLREYMTKSSKEAKHHTSWINENRAYDDATASYVEGVLTGPTAPRFLAAFLPLQQRVAALGATNSLAQTVLKIASPGVPDVYRGTELWDLTLVDPDNRRPVDFAHRASLLRQLEPFLPDGAAPPEPDAARVQAVHALVRHWPDARIKLFVTACSLRLRRSRPDLFLRGDYVPLHDDVTVPGGVLAFARQRDGEVILVLVPRLVAGLTTPENPFPLGGEAWRTSRVMLPPELAGRTYRNVFTSEEVRPVRHRDAPWIFVAEALQTCPVAILTAS